MFRAYSIYFLFLFLLYTFPFFPAEKKKYPFFATINMQYFFGNNLELFNSSQPFDSYSFVQYIFDFGTHQKKKSNTAKKPTIDFDATLRIKGIFGNNGLYSQSQSSAIKIGWSRTEADCVSTQYANTLWIRELALMIQPQENYDSFFKIGFFPYKIGNGLTLGNAYVLEAPIPGQFIYEQIDQFRPGFLCSLSTKNKTFSSDFYLGINTSLSNSLLTNGSFTNFQNLEVPFKERGSGKNNIVFVAQSFINKKVKNNTLLVNPYFFYNHNNTQKVEFPEDATSSLFSLGLEAIYETSFIRYSFECTKNFGHQHVKHWDRNQLIQTNGLSNTHLFYTPNTDLTVTTALNNDFTFSPLVIRPTQIAQSYGNGTNFLYEIEPGTEYIFKNSYDRYRNGYDNSYKGWMVYSDIIFTGKHLSVGFAGGCASGDTPPNDSYETIMLTRLTPGISYLDYDKKYAGFIGIQQLLESKSVNPLFFGQAQKCNNPLSESSSCRNAITSINFTNQGFFATTAHYKKIFEQKIIDLSGTIATYFTITALKKGISSSLWQAQSLDFTNTMQLDMNKSLSKALGTELNASIDITPFSDFTFSILGALFMPASYYKSNAGKTIPLKLQTILDLPNFSPDEDDPITFSNNCAFFLSIKCVGLF